jgi:glycosyltransferase involved in cell wall biosynthesis
VSRAVSAKVPEGDAGDEPQTCREFSLFTTIPGRSVLKKREHIIFLTRKHPESIGGVQRHSARLMAGLQNSFEIENVSWRGPEWGAPFYFPYFYHKSVSNGARLLHCDDAVTALLGARIRRKTDKKVVATVHGLDVILPIPLYQRLLKNSLPQIDRIVCVSSATAREIISRGIPEERVEIIPNAAEETDGRLPRDENLYRQIEMLTGMDVRNKRILFSLGRPLKRKGFDYFITDVFPHLPDDCVYLIAGPEPKIPLWLRYAGPLLNDRFHRLLLLASGAYTIHEELRRLSNHPRISYLNGISEEQRELLFAAADLFIMPNRKVEGDMEGFGIVALEAAVRGIPVVASGLEGVTDAVIHGQNGYCVQEGDGRGMAEIIKALLGDREKYESAGRRASEYTRLHFSSSAVHGKYEKVFRELLN